MFALYLTILLSLLCALPPAFAQRVNTQTPTARGLVALWKAVPALVGGRTWYDLAGRFHGTLTNMGAGAGWERTTRPGGVAHLRCDGTDDYVSFPPPTLTGGHYTMLFWARDEFAAGGTFNLDMVYGSNRFSLSLHQGNWGGDPQALSVLLNAATTVNLSAAYSLPTTTWTHIGVTMDATAGTIRGFLNGQETGSGGYSETFGGAGSLFHFCTRNTAAGAWARGAYDDLRLYQVTLTPAEVQRVYLESRLGDVALLPPSPLTAFLGSVPVTPGNTGSFLPFFNP